MKDNSNYKTLKNLIEGSLKVNQKTREIEKYSVNIEILLNQILLQKTLDIKVIDKYHSESLTETEMISIWLEVLKKKFDLNIKNIDYTKFMVKAHLPGESPKFLFGIEEFYNYIKQFE